MRAGSASGPLKGGMADFTLLPLFPLEEKHNQEVLKVAGIIAALGIAARVAPATARPIAKYGIGVELGVAGEIVGLTPLSATNLLPQPFGFVPARVYGLEPNFYLTPGLAKDLPTFIPGVPEQRAVDNAPKPQTPAAHLNTVDQQKVEAALANFGSEKLAEFLAQYKAGANPFQLTNPAAGAGVIEAELASREAQRVANNAQLKANLEVKTVNPFEPHTGPRVFALAGGPGASNPPDMNTPPAANQSPYGPAAGINDPLGLRFDIPFQKRKAERILIDLLPNVNQKSQLFTDLVGSLVSKVVQGEAEDVALKEVLQEYEVRRRAGLSQPISPTIPTVVPIGRPTPFDPRPGIGSPSAGGPGGGSSTSGPITIGGPPVPLDTRPGIGSGSTSGGIGGAPVVPVQLGSTGGRPVRPGTTPAPSGFVDIGPTIPGVQPGTTSGNTSRTRQRPTAQGAFPDTVIRDLQKDP